MPGPTLGAGQLLIRATRSLISPRTERMLMDFGRGRLIEKARQQPDKVCMVFDRAKTDGLLPTIEATRTSSIEELAKRSLDDVDGAGA